MSPELLYGIAEANLGVKEFPGAKHNPAVLRMFADVGHGWVEDDETPWCAAFVGSVLGQAGYQGTGSLAARSYLEWGEEVAEADVIQGDVVILWRGSPSSWQGHVGFVHEVQADTVLILGGNQGNQVSIQAYPKSKVLGYRRAATPRESIAQSKTAQASIAQITAGATAGVTAVAALDGPSQIVVMAGAVVIIVAGMVIFRERLMKWNKGIR